MKPSFVEKNFLLTEQSLRLLDLEIGLFFCVWFWDNEGSVKFPTPKTVLSRRQSVVTDFPPGILILWVTIISKRNKEIKIAASPYFEVLLLFLSFCWRERRDWLSTPQLPSFSMIVVGKGNEDWRCEASIAKKNRKNTRGEEEESSWKDEGIRGGREQRF